MEKDTETPEATEGDSPQAAREKDAERQDNGADNVDGLQISSGQTIAAEDAEETPSMIMDGLEAEVSNLKDKLLRALAEIENVRRRAERDKIEASKFAIAGFARDLLGVSDNLRRALDSVDEEARKQNELLKNLVVGIEMTEREMLNAFERNGIRQIEAIGRKFDHNFHEALFEKEDESKPAGTVVQELQAGYVLNERLLRPAKVGISKGGPKKLPAEKKPAEAETSPDPAIKEQADAYVKQSEAHPEASGTKLDEEL